MFKKTYLETNNFSIQSSDVVDAPTSDAASSVETTSEVMTFVDNSLGEVCDEHYTKNPIASVDATRNTELAGFLKRPTLIDTRTWSTGSSLGVLGSEIEPWYLFLNNAAILKKINNFAFIRAKLCIKVIINATPFHVGLLRVAYEPSVNAANTGFRVSKIRNTGFGATAPIIPYSQLPGVWLRPADNAGGTIEVPFFLHSNWLRLSSAADVKSMGKLTYFAPTYLQVASASGSSSTTIDTYAWLEDVEMCAATGELSLQAGDEYDGPISKTASAISRITKNFESVPYIGKFARASTIGASAIASIASIFGFTNVPVISDVQPLVSLPAPHLATGEISVPFQKLTLDPKQELSIDPTLHGLTAEDELAVSYIAQRKSALASLTWGTGDAVGAGIFAARVSPAMSDWTTILNSLAATAATRVNPTPMGYLCNLFTHWRGDIIFDFEVVCTKFHKGRLLVQWDPIGSNSAGGYAENVVYSTILDIGANNKASFRVPFHQAYGFLRCRFPDGTNNWNGGPPTTFVPNPTLDNGQLRVTVLTPLMSPVSPMTLSVIVWVRGAENLEFANPRSRIGAGVPPTVFAVQSRDVADNIATEVTLGDKGSSHPNRYDLHMGQNIVSLRTLMHRMSLYDVSSMEKQTNTRVCTYVKSYARVPPMYGYDPNGKFTANLLIPAVGTGNFNYQPTHPMTYISLMYGGMRGGTNYVANLSADLYPYIGDVRVQRINDSAIAADRGGAYNSGINTGTTKSAFVRYMNFQVPYAGDGGACLTNTQTNGTISWYHPHMDGVNFKYPDPTSTINGNTSDQSDKECSYMEVYLKQNVSQTVSDVFTVTSYAGAGTDFTCLWWLCCPTLDIYASNPVAP